jgi:LCP family protein required for cell wall assembly
MAPRRRHQRAPRHRTWGQRILLTALSILTVGCLGAATAAVWAYGKVNDLVRFGDDEVAVQEAPPGEPANFLIVGSDSRENVSPEDPTLGSAEQVGGSRSDTIMVMRIDPAETQIDVVSFPRDLYLPLATGRTDRINAAYGQGRQVLIDTIQQNFGITINHYVEVDFNGFQRMVEAIDGVDVYLDATYRDRNSGLVPVGPGCVNLDGDQALAFARARALERWDDDAERWRTDPTADLGRITRQQFLIRRSVAQVQSLNPFTNPLTFTNLLDVAVSSVGVDGGLSNDDLRDLAGRFRDFDPDTMLNHALPVTGFRTSGGAAVLRLDEGPETDAILNIFRGLDPGEVLPSQVSVDVHNGSGAEMQGTHTASALSTLGFQAEVRPDAEPTEATTIAYAPGSEAAALLVASHLTSQAEYVEDDSLDANHLVLTTGADFTTVVRQPWPEGTVEGPTTTTTSTTTTEPGETTTTTEPPTTTTTEPIGFLPEAPEGVDC